MEFDNSRKLELTLNINERSAEERDYTPDSPVMKYQEKSAVFSKFDLIKPNLPKKIAQ
jgi:hypothetical protein